MTVSSDNRKAGPYTGNDSTTAFPFYFYVFSAADLVITKADAAGNETTLTLSSDYTVSLNSDQSSNPGGTVTLSSALSSANSLTITSDVANTQGIDFNNLGGFYPKLFNTALDKLTVLIQQLSEKVSRTLKLAVSTPTGVSPNLPKPISGRILGWNNDGTAIINQDPTYGGADALKQAFSSSNGAGMVGFKLSKVGSALRNLNDFIGDSLPTPEMFNNGIKYANYKSGANWYEDSAFTIPATDCASTIQNAINMCGGVKLASGKNYYLASPLAVNSNTAIITDVGRLSGWYSSGALSSFRPSTCAIKTSDYNDQKLGFTLRNIGFVGGTTQVDLGLFHDVEISGCEFKDATGTNLVLVRGEKHLITRNRFDAATVNTYCAMSLGRWQDSLNSSNYSDAYFGAAGAFFDRGTITNNVIQAGPSGVFGYGILSNILSGTVLSDLTFHGNSNAGGEVAVIWVRDRIQQCQISVIAPDAIGSDGNKLNSLFYAGQVLNSTFINVSPQFSGTCKYVKGFDIPYAVNSVFIGCRADGDNSTQFGFYFGVSVGDTCTLINCSGAFYHASSSALIRNQVAQVNCNFSQGNNGSASGQANILNQDVLSLLMADINGATADTAKWGAMFASGSGGSAIPFYVKKEGAWINTGSRLYLANQYGETYPQSIIVNIAGSVLPEGNVSAYPGSLYLYYVSNTSGKLYVKETGTGNTGWVLK